MSRNIIICADGTGNSGGTGEVTNVWRLYEAIALQDASQPQVATHDDGVGTQSFKYVHILGLGVGLGLSRNLSELYHYLIRTYVEGDRIFLFGFSRGAFTVRALANILYFCGIADRHELDKNGNPRLDANGNKRLRSPEELEALSDRAVAAHQTRNWKAPDDPWSDAYRFRTTEGLKHHGAVGGDGSDYQKHDQGRFPIEFLGVWDTVDAVGLPFDEMTQYCLRRVERKVERMARRNKRPGGFLALERLFGHVLRRTSPSYKDKDGNVCWEDDASYVLRNSAFRLPDPGNPNPDGECQPFIRRIYHAISIDDERYTFHPTLFLENGRALTEANAVVEQVWFPGVHANVGGGYPKDGLAYVSLAWMMHHASQAGLKFNEETWQSYRLLADPDGPLYDSRAGLGRFYRYKPRKLKLLCDDAGIGKPILHPAVFSRLGSRVQDYAPTGIPEDYVCAYAPEFHGQLPLGGDPELIGRRMSLQQSTEELIWWRRAVYYSFVSWIALWVAVNFSSESVLDTIAVFVRWLDCSGFKSLTTAWYVFSVLTLFLAGLFQWRSRAAAKRKEANTNVVKWIRREFFWVSLRNLSLGTLGILAFHEPVTLFLDWSLPAVLSPLVNLLRLSPVVLLSVFYGSYTLLRCSTALIRAIGTTASAVWDASLLMQSDPAAATSEGFLGWLYRTARKQLNKERKHWALEIKWKIGPACVFWLVMVASVVGILMSASSVVVRFRTAGERFAYTSDSLDALASIYPHGRIEFEPIEEIDFSTKEMNESTKELSKGSYYLVLAVPLAWEQRKLHTDDCPPGELPYVLRGEYAFDDPLTSKDAARLWGWQDASIPATPEGLVESEMNLITQLIMKLAAPLRCSASLPWFQLIGRMEQASDLLIPVGTSVIFQAPADGTLTLYVNDVPEFYCNNSGQAKIRIYRCWAVE
ncbi:hypothetical protein GC176_07905 [bacterium]|nr:hypothetical protein [bacterium]